MQGSPLIYIRIHKTNGTEYSVPFVFVKKQSTCKPGSVPQRGVCHSSIPDVTIGLKRSTLRLGRATLKRRFTRTCSSQDARLVHRCTTGGLLPHLLTLTLTGGCFLLRYSAFADSFLLGSGMLCAARTFLPCLWQRRQTVRLLFCAAKVSIVSCN